jgi:hypothetical protein
MVFEIVDPMNEQQHFYVLEEPRPGSREDDIGGTRASRAKGFQVGDAPKCPRCGRFIGMLTWLPPFRVEIETWGRQFGDVIKVGGCDLLVSSCFRQQYEMHRLKGLLNFYPVEIVKVKRHQRLDAEPPEYFKTSVIRSRTAVDQEESGFEWEDDEPVCPECLWKEASGTLRAFKSVVLRTSTWTGDDICYPRGSPVNVVVSSRFRDVCVESELTNVVFLPTETYSWRKKFGEP